MAADVKRRLRTDLADCVRPYRGGYLSAERREIERKLFSGSLRGVVATTALELGIDVGGLDACVLNGFPGTIASMWQQAGRAGRETQTSVAALVAGDDQLDQWFMHHPEELFTRPPEPAVVNPTNPHVLLPHLACAAYELPLTPLDDRWWPDLLDDGVRRLVLDDVLKLRPPSHRRGTAAVWAGRGWPSHRVGLRNAGNDEYRIATADGTLVGTVDGSRAFRLVHPGAVYLHQGRAWRVAELDLDDQVAVVEPADGGEYTQPRTATEIAVLDTEQQRQVGSAHLGLGPVRVRSQVIGYRRFDVFTGEQLGLHDLDLPPGELVTTGVLVRGPRRRARRRRGGAGGGARRPARCRTRRHRHPAAVHHLRPVGRRRGVHPVSPRDRCLHDRHLRRLPRRCRCGRARLRGRRPPPRRPPST